MQLKIIVDNKSASEGYTPAWGFACMVGEVRLHVATSLRWHMADDGPDGHG